MSDEDFNMQTVTSGNLSEVGFNQETKQGRIRFAKSGALYEYDSCSQEEFEMILSAPSANDAFVATWKNHQYRRLE